MNRARLDAVLESAFRIRPGEGRQVFRMFLYLMGVVSTFIVGRTVRDTLFLRRALAQLAPRPELPAARLDPALVEALRRAPTIDPATMRPGPRRLSVAVAVRGGSTITSRAAYQPPS